MFRTGHPERLTDTSAKTTSPRDHSFSYDQPGMQNQRSSSGVRIYWLLKLWRAEVVDDPDAEALWPICSLW